MVTVAGGGDTGIRCSFWKMAQCCRGRAGGCDPARPFWGRPHSWPAPGPATPLAIPCRPRPHGWPCVKPQRFQKPGCCSREAGDKVISPRTHGGRVPCCPSSQGLTGVPARIPSKRDSAKKKQKLCCTVPRPRAQSAWVLSLSPSQHVDVKLHSHSPSSSCSPPKSTFLRHPAGAWGRKVVGHVTGTYKDPHRVCP